MSRVPANAAPGTSPGTEVLIEVVGADQATQGLLQEWLGASGFRVVERGTDGGSTSARPVLTIADIPYMRQGATELLRRISESHPGTPVLALSPTFFGHVACDSDCARALGVAGVLPKPFARQALIGAVEHIVSRKE